MTSHGPNLSNVPIDPPAPDTGITFLRSTTTTTIDREQDGDTQTTVKHLARFAVELGAIPDHHGQYSTRLFRPEWMQVTWVDGELNRVYLSGPRVLKQGLSQTQKSNIEIRRPYRDYGQPVAPPFDRAGMAAVMAAVIESYERAVAAAGLGVTE